MKLFWAIVILFIAAAGLVMFIQSRSPEAPTTTAMQGSPQPEVADDTAVYESPLFAPSPDDDEDALDNDESDVITEGQDVAVDDDAAARELAEDLLASSQDRAGENGEPYGEVGDWLISPGSGDKGGGDHQHQTITTGENPWAVEGDFALGDERLAAQRLQHSIVQQEDGSLLLDDTFVIRGDGSEANPYEVTWDLLMSAAETYQPRLGMEDVPERVAMLEGKHVKISGHLMFPMITGQADELLVMLNMWDGCCIGTMPSPYDAIEVQLAAPAAVGSQQFFNYGTIEGKFSVDPYLINDWLIGLYIIDEAKLNVGM